MFRGARSGAGTAGQRGRDGPLDEEDTTKKMKSVLRFILHCRVPTSRFVPPPPLSLPTSPSLALTLTLHSEQLRPSTSRAL